MSESLFGIDHGAGTLWSGYVVRSPSGVDRNRTCALDWARGLRAGVTHPQDGYVMALIRYGLRMAPPQSALLPNAPQGAPA